MKIWTVDLALEVIRSLHPKMFELGWNLHLGGGVLIKGSSAKDVDVVALPRWQTRVHIKTEAVEEMTRHGFTLVGELCQPCRHIFKFTHGVYPDFELIFFNPPI